MWGKEKIQLCLLFCREKKGTFDSVLNLKYFIHAAKLW
jgi:hypothetical protein